jgi:hypothetical protein
VRKPKLLVDSHVLGSFLPVGRCENNRAKSREFTMGKEKQRNENLSLALVVSPQSIIHRRCVSTNDVFIAFVCFAPLINNTMHSPRALRKRDWLEEE